MAFRRFLNESMTSAKKSLRGGSVSASGKWERVTLALSHWMRRSAMGGKRTFQPVAFRSLSWRTAAMKTDLLDLLNQTEIVHPTRIVAVEASHRQLRITIAGYPWWRNDVGGEEGQIVFSFHGVGEGVLDAETLLDMEEDEALEVFEVSLVSDQGWADEGTSYATYCSEPLPHPLTLYAVIEDYLWNTGAPRSARDFLNVPDGSLARFRQITNTSSFLVAQSPQHVHDVVVGELRRQNVSHNVLTSERASSRNLFVKIGDASFICERATAES